MKEAIEKDEFFFNSEFFITSLLSKYSKFKIKRIKNSDLPKSTKNNSK
jgi:hypothetical protein